MKAKKFILIITALLLGLAAQAQNILSVPDIVGAAGKTIAVPIQMTNQDEVVAVQFDVQLPFSKASGEPMLNASRSKNGHTVGIRSLGGNRYTVVIASMANKSLAGTSGTLVSIPMTVSSSAEYGDGNDYSIRLSNVVITNRRGDNIASGSTDGTFSVQRAPSPDLAVSDVCCSASDLAPEQKVRISWRVGNHGEVETGSGWYETISLVNVATGETYFLANAYNSDRLMAGGSILRQADVTVPATVGTDGEVAIRVTLVPNGSTGELLVDRADNEATSEATYMLSKHLYLTTSVTRLPEGSSARLTLKRSGDRSMAETFSLVCSAPELLSVPATVTFPAGQSAVAIDVQCPQNVDVNTVDEVTVTLTPAYGYEAVECALTIVDDDLYPMQITTDKTEYNEGDVIHATITVPRRIGDQELTAYLSIEDAKRFKLPLSVTFEPGMTTAGVDIPVVQDKKPANTVSVELTATADHYQTARTLFQLNDDDVPAITFTMTPTEVSEGDGPAAMYCTITRSEVTDNKITVKISDDSDGELTYGNGSRSGRTFTMEPGVTTINWYMGPQNNDLVDGDRTVVVTAAVYVTDCNCTAIGNLQSSMSHTVTIHDNDGPTLTLTSEKTTILEGDPNGTAITVTRNDGYDHALAVALVCEDSDVQLTQSTLTIPVGQKTATARLSVSKNAAEGDDRIIMLHATAEGFTEGSTWIYVTDQTLIDYNVDALVPDATTVVSGEGTVLTLTVSNQGAIGAAAPTTFSIKQGGQSIYTGQIPAIAKDAQTTQRVALTLPQVPGTYKYTLEVNPQHHPAELLYQNNTVQFDITVVSAYEYTATTDKTTYNEGETVHLSGTALHTGTPQADMKVEPYVVSNGERYALEATSAADGTWKADFTMPDGVRGDFTYGVCDPGAEETSGTGSFTVYGLARATSGYLKHPKLYVGEDYVANIPLVNLSRKYALTNVRVESATDDAGGTYEFAAAPISYLEPGAEADLEYRVRATEASPARDWQHITVHLTSDEGAKLTATIYVYAALREPKLVLSTTSITTTVNKDEPRTYPIILTNTGLGETGKISIDMPKGLAKFVSLVTPSTLPSLATGDSATVVLRFDGTGYDVNFIQKGSIAFNCENGNYEMLYFNVKTVSEAMGSLRVRVGDETTYYGDKDGNHPYLQGALVSLKDQNTGATLYSDITGEDGTITMNDIKEGYYRLNVTADKHNSYNDYVYVNPGEQTSKEVNISYQAITITWDVEETTVEDVYDIKTTLTYETHVPVPVCLISMPDTIPIYQLEAGQTMMFNIVTRNVGLITATDCTVSLPTAPGFTFTALKPTEGFSLAAETSNIIPVLVTRNAESGEGGNQVARRASGSTCYLVGDMGYHWPCFGNTNSGSTSDTSSTGSPHCGGGPGSPGHTDPAPPSGPGKPGNLDPSPTRPDGDPSRPGHGGDFDICEFIKCMAINAIPHSACPAAGYEYVSTGSVSGLSVAGCVLDILSFVPVIGPAAGAAGGAVGALGCLAGSMGSSARRAASEHDLLKVYTDRTELYLNHMGCLIDAFTEIVGATDAITIENQFHHNIGDIEAVIDELRNEGTFLDLDPASIQPNALTEAQARALYADNPEELDEALAYIGTPQWRMVNAMPNAYFEHEDFSVPQFVERMQNYDRIYAGIEPTNSNHPDHDVLEGIQERIDKCNEELFAMGYVDYNELAEAANLAYNEYQQGASKNACAKVKLEINQQLVITRQAFRGTLTIDNSSNMPLNDITLNLLVQRVRDGLTATSHEMQINFESLEGFNETLASHPTGGWSLDPGNKGVLTVLFIPTKYAAPTNLETYSFGGTLFFNDGENDRSEGLYPVSLQVKPSPELDLDYFVQRDIYGDNPLTTDIVEPIVPAEFTVLIHNKGYGEATNVRMLTQQPQIVENEKGLLVDFEIVSSSLNGGEKSLALGESIATDFGSIDAGTCSYATWDLTCSLLGHFTDYNVEATHVTSYGNPDLSLLDNVSIHELIHSVNAKIDGTVYRAWVVNDYEDGHAEPDHIYFSNGTNEEVRTLNDATTLDDMGDGDASTYRLTVNVPTRGWFYSSVINPSGGMAKIERIYDETHGRELDPENFWTTAYVMQDGFDPLEEQRFHIVDLADGPGAVSYIVTFEPMPEVRLDVVSVVGVPNDLPPVEELVLEPVTHFDVTFNKPIDPFTFDDDDIIIRYEGKQQPSTRFIDSIEPLDDTNTVFRIHAHSFVKDGVYTFQVRSQDVEDTEGFPGQNGRIVRWMLYQDGMIHFFAGSWPENAGEVLDYLGATLTEGTADYSSDVTLQAVPAEGYNFEYWAIAPKQNTSLSRVWVDNCEFEAESNARAVRYSAPDKPAMITSETQLTPIGNDPVITVPMYDRSDLRAVFSRKQYTVLVNYDAKYVSPAFAETRLSHGDELVFSAEGTQFDYEIIGYRVTMGDAEPVVYTTTDLVDDVLYLTMTGNATIDVLYADHSTAKLLLSENLDYTPEDVESAYVGLYRSFRRGMWNTICLPVGIADPADVFGSGTQVAAFTGVEDDVLTFSLVDHMQAHVPYLISPGRLMTNSKVEVGASQMMTFALGETSITAPSDTPVVLDGLSHSGTVVSSASPAFDFIGTYDVTTLAPADGNYYVSSNTLYNVDQTAVSVGRFRAYFHTDEAALSAFRLAVGTDGGPVGIDAATADALPPTAIFDAQGRRLGTGNQPLRSGVYIIGGRKCIVK